MAKAPSRMSVSSTPVLDTRRGSSSHGVVLVLVTASALLQLLVTNTDFARFVVIVLQAVTLIAAVRTSGARRTVVRLASAAAAVAAVAALVLWIVHGSIPQAPSAIVNGLLVAVAPAVIAAGLVRELRAERRVTVSMLSGVLAIYLLAGMFFSFTYGVVEAVDPDALFAGRSSSTGGRSALLQLRLAEHGRIWRLRAAGPRPARPGGRRDADRADLPGHRGRVDREQPRARPARKRAPPEAR